METIVMNLPDTSKRTHELAQAERARKLARVVRAAVVEARRQTPGSLSS
jgi:Na+-transporting methylmalonyl-CoA/oxaloacetate decarboxylase gamma subunit